MKIAMLYASWEKFGEPWSTPHGIRDEFLRRGHEVRQYNLYHNDGWLDTSRKGQVRQYSDQGINKMHAEYRGGGFIPDVVLLMDYGPYDSRVAHRSLLPEAKWIYEMGDCPQSFRMHFPRAQKYDAVLCPDHQCTEILQKSGINAHWWTHFGDTSIYKPDPDANVEYDCVSTCGPRGNGAPVFTDKVKTALRDAFNNERYFFGLDHAERLNMGKMVFQHSQFGELTRRVFEGMACGKMVITDRLSDATNINALFTEGEDIVYYDREDPEDAIEKIRYYATHDEERERIAANGLRKVLESHTQVQRVDKIEEIVNG